MRVHELAKELGLKSHELLERIKGEGLDVKDNALASLDPAMVERIRSLIRQPGGGRDARGPATAGAGAPSRPVASGGMSAPPSPGMTSPVRGGGEPPRPAVPRPSGLHSAPRRACAAGYGHGNIRPSGSGPERDDGTAGG